MNRYRFVIPLLIIGIIAGALIPAYQPARAQDAAFPLPAPLYILTSKHVLIRVDPVNGSQTAISSEDQPIVDFDIAPDGAWYVYRTAANNGAVIISVLEGISGSVLEMGGSMLTETSTRQTIAWSPDAAMIAYLVPEGVRIARLNAGQYGEAMFDTLPGSWVELYWTAPGTLIAGDFQANTTIIRWENNAWKVLPGSDRPARPQPPILSFLTPQGVTLENYTVVPGTAGALAFAWGPLPPPQVESMMLPYNLYFLAQDAAGIAQVWQWPQNNAPARPLTAESTPVITYAVAPDQSQLGYVTGDRVIAARFDGTQRRELAQLVQSAHATHHIAWSPDGSQVAYYDSRGVWIVPAAGGQPPRIVAQSTAPEDPSGNVRLYTWPQWSPDGTRLLVIVALYEGSLLGIVDPNTGQVTDLNSMTTSQAHWTGDGRVITWASEWGYNMPGLYLLDPAAPNAAPLTLLDSRSPVAEAVQGSDGAWYALVGTTAGMGPQFLRVYKSAALNAPFAPLYDSAAGSFTGLPQIAPPAPGWNGPVLVAGLRGLIYDEQSFGQGELVITAMDSGTAVRVKTSGPVWDVQWGSPLP